MTKTFASQNDLTEKKKTFQNIAPGAYAYTTEGDPNSGVIIGDHSVMVIDAQATPAMAEDVIAQIRKITDKPIKYLVLSHYHAVRVLGASAYNAQEIVCSEKTLEMIHERGAQDWLSEYQRFPRLFQDFDSIPSLTYPTITFSNKITIDLGNKPIEIMHLGEGHTRGDTIAWLSQEKALFAGDLVEYGATPYCGDAQLGNWSSTLQALSALKPETLVPGRGEAITDSKTAQLAIKQTDAYTSMLFEHAKTSVAQGEDLKTCYNRIVAAMKPLFGHWVIFEHCMPFNVKRAYDEAKGISHPEIWTDKKDIDMWNTLKN